MARTVSTDHNFPDIHDEGKIKRYGLSIFIVLATIVLLLFVIWATNIGWQNQFGPAGPSPSERTRPQP
jgi:hypothetical protein